MMAFGSFDSGVSRPMVEINTTPLIDVMLVLLIIFLVTAPLLTQSIRVDLPQATAQANEDDTSEPVRLALDAAGVLYWNDEPFAEAERLEERLRLAVAADPLLEIRFSADRETRYQRVAEILAAAKRAGVAKLGFMTVPDSEDR
jgi:biopolymer transport protein ExbD